MQREVLLQIVEQNRFTSHFSFDRITQENAALRLNDRAASIGFIYRHIGETVNLFGQFFGIPTDVTNTTMGQTDHGQPFDVEYSRQLIARGYESLRSVVENSNDEDWLHAIDTPFFGTVPRIRLFAHVLFHTSHHAGQISLTLSKGRNWPEQREA
ncbi:MAG TPA: DinB family protein [Acidobacteriaceae bacterium]